MNNTDLTFEDPFEFSNNYQGDDKARKYVDRIASSMRKSGFGKVVDGFVLIHLSIKTKTFEPLRKRTYEPYKQID
jgi:hypothetical protein